MENNTDPVEFSQPNLLSEEGNGLFNNAIEKDDNEEQPHSNSEQDDDDYLSGQLANGGEAGEEQSEDFYDADRELNDIAFVNEVLDLGIEELPEGLRLRDLFVHTVQDLNNFWKEKLSENALTPANGFVAGLNEYIINGGTELEFLSEFIKDNNLSPQPQAFTAEELRAAYREQLVTQDGYSPEEADEEIDILQNAGTLQRKLDSLAKKLQAERPPADPQAILQSLAQGQQKTLEDQQAEYHAFMSGLQSSAQKLTTYKELPVQEQQVSDAIAFATQHNPATGNTYLEDAMRNPDLVLRVAMELLYGEEYTNTKVNKAFEKGKSFLREKYSDEPVINTKQQNKLGVDIAALRTY